jgi:thioredoxin 2
MLLDRPVLLDDESFARTVEGSDVPVLVDFYADWCGPCRMMAPFMDQLAAKVTGRALVVKVDTERARQVAAQYDIRGLPTVAVFANGSEVARQMGAMPLQGLEQLLAKAGVVA